jgi:hypothetical protein
MEPRRAKSQLVRGRNYIVIMRALSVERVLALPLGQMPHVVVPLGHTQLDLGVDKAFAQRLAQRR